MEIMGRRHQRAFLTSTMTGTFLALAVLVGSTPQTDADLRLEEAVLDAVLEHPEVRSYALVVEVEDGVATLRGVVGSEEVSDAAERTAREVEGVRDVVNALIVRPAVELTDPEIELYVDQALSRDPLVDSHEIVVTVLDGNVNLHGTVDDEAEKDRASVVAGRVLGVEEVENELTLAPQILQATSDEALERAIAQKLAEVFDGLTVRVDRGVATLTGTVSSREEKQRAEELAFDAGATLVKNEIQIAEPPS